ncbi:MAG: type II secretion system protein [Deltaproteobacteria bacterium]|jgi:type II secretory pathway pseudopilin PulG|nr:type II secretion system protein [Deltaproteobacteria bacterium]
MSRGKVRGFTLIEAVLIMAVVGSAFFGFGYLFGNLDQEALTADLSVLATKLAREKIEEVFQTKADGGAGGYALVVDEGSATVTSGAWSFSRTVDTTYVSPGDFSPSLIDTGYKKVEVVVSWGVDAGESVTLTSMVTDMVPSAVAGAGGFTPCP